MTQRIRESLNAGKYLEVDGLQTLTRALTWPSATGRNCRSHRCIC